MINKLLVLILISQLFQSCSISGTYYVVNASDERVSVKLTFAQAHQYMREDGYVRSGTYTGKKIEYHDFENMTEVFYEVDTLSRSVSFVMEPRTYTFIGYGSNHSSHIDIIEIDKLQDALKINEEDREEVAISSQGLGKYVGVITVDHLDDTVTPPVDGEYVYEVAFAEWDGKSLGDKVQLVIKDGKAKVIFMEGSISGLKEGDIIDEGYLLRHKSGEWIIAPDRSSIDDDEVGGCTGGPAIVDFVKKQYEMC